MLTGHYTSLDPRLIAARGLAMKDDLLDHESVRLIEYYIQDRTGQIKRIDIKRTIVIINSPIGKIEAFNLIFESDEEERLFLTALNYAKVWFENR